MPKGNGAITWKKLLFLIGGTIALCTTVSFTLSQDMISVREFDLLREDIRRVEQKVDQINEKVEALKKE